MTPRASAAPSRPAAQVPRHTTESARPHYARAVRRSDSRADEGWNGGRRSASLSEDGRAEHLQNDAALPDRRQGGGQAKQHRLAPASDKAAPGDPQGVAS